MFNEVFRAMMIFVTSATILQNGLILAGTVVNYGEVKKTVPQRAIILSTTIADLVMGLVVMPFGLYFEFNNGWDLGVVLCDFWISCDILCSTASIVSIAFHSMDKYYSLWTPNRYYGHVRHNWSRLFVGITWGLSGFVALSAGASGWARNDDWSHSSEYSANQLSLEDDIVDLDNFELHMLMHAQLKALQPPVEECTITNNPMFALYSAAVSFYIPAAAIVYYSIQIRELAFLTLEERQHRKRMLAKKRRASGAVKRKLQRQNIAILAAVANRGFVSRSRRSQIRGRERQIAILWELTILTFLICWAPFFITHPLSCFGITIPEKILIVLPWLGYSHSIVNPILHAFLEPDYLRSFAKLFIKCFAKLSKKRPKKTERSDSVISVTEMPSSTVQPAAGPSSDEIV